MIPSVTRWGAPTPKDLNIPAAYTATVPYKYYPRARDIKPHWQEYLGSEADLAAIRHFMDSPNCLENIWDRRYTARKGVLRLDPCTVYYDFPIEGRFRITVCETAKMFTLSELRNRLHDAQLALVNLSDA